MKTKIGIALAAVAALVAALVVAIQPAHAAVGIRVSNGVLVEGNGTPLKLRGINHPHVWYTNQTSSFANIKAAGANSVRVVLSGGRWATMTTAQVAEVVNLCKVNKLICVLENHDTTGYNEQQSEYTLDRSVTWYNSVRDALIGQENYVIINIGNEPFGNGSNPVSSSAWTQQTAAAVQRMRSLGFEHTIMVDAPNWGQDWGFVMRDTAQTVRNADATGNIIFAIHMYGVFDTAAEVNAYVDSFTSRNLALCICEFGDNHSDGNPDENAIMAKAEQASIGMMGWSWSGNGGGVEYLDMVIGFNPAQRSSWGNRFITGANGLSTTSREATIYSGGPTGTPNPPPPPGTPGTPTASNVTNTSLTLSWAASSGIVSNYQIERCTGSTCTNFVQVATSSTTSTGQTGLTANTTYRYRVRATNSTGNSAYSAITNVTTTNVISPQPPGTPGTLSVSGTTSSATTLSWGASSGTVTNYQIERATGATSTTFTQVGTSTSTTFTNTGLAANTTYRYRVRAANSAGTSAYSNIVNVTTTGGTQTGGCSATYAQTNSWPGGFQGQVTVTNTGTSATTGWTVVMTFANGQTITQIWGGRTTVPASSPVTVANESWNGNLGASASTSFGFLGSWNGTNNAPTVTCSRTP